MTRAALEEKMNEFGFRKTFESSYETVWNRGKNQLELLNDGTILLSRGRMVMYIPLETVEDVSEERDTWPEVLVFSLTNGIHADIEYKL